MITSSYKNVGIHIIVNYKYVSFHIITNSFELLEVFRYNTIENENNTEV